MKFEIKHIWGELYKQEAKVSYMLFLKKEVEQKQDILCCYV